MATFDLPGSQYLSLPVPSCSLPENVDVGQATAGGGGGVGEGKEAGMNVCG